MTGAPAGVRPVTCSMGVSADGYVVGPNGRFDWSEPDPDLFSAATDEVRRLGVHLLGRRLYETMRYWETADRDPSLDDAGREFATLWQALPKVVFSRSSPTVEGNARLAAGGLREEVERWRARPGKGAIAIGGATLAAAAAALGLVDEYRVRVHPVLVGGGTPFFPREGRRVDLELLESRTSASGVVVHRYRVAGRPASGTGGS
jgi:dihydrofolate reductase